MVNGGSVMLKHNFYGVLRRSLFACFCSAILFVSISVVNSMFGMGHNYNGDIVHSNLVSTAATAENTTTIQKTVYLTFDDGPSKVTESVLDILKEKNVKATFFVISAENNEEYFPLVERIINEQHKIGVHSKTHAYSEIYASSEAFWQDISLLEADLAQYGATDIKLLRFPGGSTNTVSHKYGGSEIMEALKDQATQKGYRYFDWNIDTQDAVGSSSSANQIYNRVINQAEDKTTCVVLMHDTKETSTTVQALPDIIDWFIKQGYTFDTLDNKPIS